MDPVVLTLALASITSTAFGLFLAIRARRLGSGG